MEVSEGEDQAVEAIVEGEIMEMIEGENKSLTFDLAMPDKLRENVAASVSHVGICLTIILFCTSFAFILCGQSLESVHCFRATRMYCLVAEFAWKFACDMVSCACLCA